MQETVRVGSDLHFLPSQTLNRAKVDASLRQRFSGNAFSTLVEVIVFTLGSPKGPFIYYVSTFCYQPQHFHEFFVHFSPSLCTKNLKLQHENLAVDKKVLT